MNPNLPSHLTRSDHLLTAAELEDKYGHCGNGGEHPQFLRSDWKYAVSNDNTVLGYWAWVECQIEQLRDKEG